MTSSAHRAVPHRTRCQTHAERKAQAQGLLDHVLAEGERGLVGFDVIAMWLGQQGYETAWRTRPNRRTIWRLVTRHGLPVVRGVNGVRPVFTTTFLLAAFLAVRAGIIHSPVWAAHGKRRWPTPEEREAAILDILRRALPGAEVVLNGRERARAWFRLLRFRTCRSGTPSAYALQRAEVRAGLPTVRLGHAVVTSNFRLAAWAASRPGRGMRALGGLRAPGTAYPTVTTSRRTAPRALAGLALRARA